MSSLTHMWDNADTSLSVIGDSDGADKTRQRETHRHLVPYLPSFTLKYRTEDQYGVAIYLQYRTTGPVSSYIDNRASMFRFIRRRKGLAVTVFLMMFGFILVLLAFIPRSYEASMEFLINNERINSPVGPDKNTQAIFYLDDVSEARINTEVALLTSNDLLTQVVQECHLASYVQAAHISEQQRQEQALGQLKAHLVVSPVKKSAIIQVRYQSANPTQSVEVLRSLSKLYLESHLRLRGATGSSIFFEELWREYSVQREAAVADLAQYKLEHSIVSLPDEKALGLQREADLEKQYSDALAAANRSGSQSAKLTSLLVNTPPSVVGERKSIPNQAEMQQLSTLLVGLQNKRVEAASRYLPDDRFVKDLDQQIAQTRAALDSAASTNTRGSFNRGESGEKQRSK